MIWLLRRWPSPPPKRKGSGPGLTTVYSIIKNYGRKILKGVFRLLSIFLEFWILEPAKIYVMPSS